MSNKEKELARKLMEAIDALPEKEQKYMEGLADGIALSKETGHKDAKHDEEAKGKNELSYINR